MSFVVPAGATQLQLGIVDNWYTVASGSGFVVDVNGTQITVPATAMPWNWAAGGLNSNYEYGLNDGTSPKIAASSLSAGGIVSVTYVSGTVSANSPVRPVVSANGDQTSFPVRRFGKGPTSDPLHNYVVVSAGTADNLQRTCDQQFWNTSGKCSGHSEYHWGKCATVGGYYRLQRCCHLHLHRNLRRNG